MKPQPNELILPSPRKSSADSPVPPPFFPPAPPAHPAPSTPPQYPQAFVSDLIFLPRSSPAPPPPKHLPPPPPSTPPPPHDTLQVSRVLIRHPRPSYSSPHKRPSLTPSMLPPPEPYSPQSSAFPDSSNLLIDDTDNEIITHIDSPPRRRSTAPSFQPPPVPVMLEPFPTDAEQPQAVASEAIQAVLPISHSPSKSSFNTPLRLVAEFFQPDDSPSLVVSDRYPLDLARKISITSYYYHYYFYFY
jgi:hypothetical protein